MEPLKNLLNFELLKKLAILIEEKENTFKKNDFLSSFSELNSLEFKQRCDLISHNLDIFLPKEIEKIEKITLFLTQKTNGWVFWPIQNMLAKRYSSKENSKKDVLICINLLKEITQKFTSEFAIRYFLLNHFEITHKKMIEFSRHSNEHVRRFSSEGTRPILPWGLKLKVFELKPELNKKILDNLKNDSSLYVRKSVANHLNDISKKNELFVINWFKENKDDYLVNKNIQFIVNHSCRTLIKKGNKEILNLLNFNTNIKIKNFKILKFESIIKKENKQELVFCFNLITNENLIIDYKLISPSKNINKNKIKLIKGKKMLFKQGKNNIFFHHLFKDNSVNNYYLGKYTLKIIINGNEIDEINFEVI